MENYSTIYWLTRIGAMKDLFDVAMILGFVLIIVYFLIMLFYSIENDETEGYVKKFGIAKKAAIVMIVMGALGSTFTPSRNEMILILAGGKTLDYVQADTSLQKLPFQTTQIISEYMDKVIKDMKEEDKKN